MTAILFFVCLGLTALFVWALRSPGTLGFGRGRLWAGAVMMPLLAAFAGYAWLREAKAPSDLERVIPVYPDAVSSSGWFPQVNEDRFWVFETSDGLDAVAAFYEQVAGESGWSLQHSGNGQMLSIKMEKDGTEVSLQVLNSGRKSKLTYIVSDQD